MRHFSAGNPRGQGIRAGGKPRTYAGLFLRGFHLNLAQARDPRKPEKARIHGLFQGREPVTERVSAAIWGNGEGIRAGLGLNRVNPQVVVEKRRIDIPPVGGIKVGLRPALRGSGLKPSVRAARRAHTAWLRPALRGSGLKLRSGSPPGQASTTGYDLRYAGPD